MKHLSDKGSVALLATAMWVTSCVGDSVGPVDAPDALGSYAVGHTMFTTVDAHAY